ncbi:hypothetical protein WAI453_002286 [Rhynchosporium graminicola]
MVPTLTSTAPEPIPLRAITLLINYERMISDPRYKGLKLGGTSRGDPQMITGVMKIAPRIWDNEPESVKRRTVHIFAPELENPKSDTVDTADTTDTTDSKTPPAACDIHSSASAGVIALSPAERDLIFHETRAHDGCYNATGMYQDFFALCPPGQEISIQVGNETPVSIDVSRRVILEYTLHEPKHNILSLIEHPSTCTSPESYTWTSSGASPSENHCVMAFFPSQHLVPSSGYFKPSSKPSKKLENAMIIDMTRLQYGDAGFGTYGENYFLGSYGDYSESMKGICGELKLKSIVGRTAGRLNDPDNQARVKTCARRAWERWMEREKEGWCEYCGRGGKELMMCGACKGRKVWYCCEEHAKKGWKLHKLTCESVGEKKVVFGPKRKEDVK